MKSELNLGLIVPCRNEASVIERKLRNLRGLRWPEAEHAHRVIVVDDGSEDETGVLARAAIESLAFPSSVRIEVVSNDVRAGKPGAIRAGLGVLGTSTALLGISDADVILGSDAVELTIEAFASDPILAMGSGEQVFVRELPRNGVVVAAQLEPAADSYDRMTACWRRFESRFGALFSVHGQWLIWRSQLTPIPRFGLAADDLDLMLQIRRARPQASIALVRGAKFYERKTPAGTANDEQALRRARAYIQLVRSETIERGGARASEQQWRAYWNSPQYPQNAAFQALQLILFYSGVDGESLARRLQWLAYRLLPIKAPGLTLFVVILMLVIPAVLWGTLGATVAFAVLAVFACSGPGRSFLRTLRMISAASRLEDTETLPESWEMARDQ